MREFIINKNDANQRLDKFIQKTIKGIPASLMYKSIRTKKIKVNRKRAELNQILCQGALKIKPLIPRGNSLPVKPLLKFINFTAPAA